jgi:hypothetical protein
MSIAKGAVGTIVGETNPLAFKFIINKEVGRGTYIKAKADGRASNGPTPPTAQTSSMMPPEIMIQER